MISATTKLYLSVSAKPGNFGAAVYNSLFAQYKIDAVYVPRAAPSAEALISCIRALDVSGCSVSMPLKSKVTSLLDSVEPIAEQTGSVNTIVNQNGRLQGYNCDYVGLVKALEQMRPKTALVYGAGSVTRSVVAALRNLESRHIAIFARRPEASEQTARQLDVELTDVRQLSDRNDSYELFINATPASSEDPLDRNLQLGLSKAEALFDLVASASATPLVQAAQGQGKIAITGLEMYKFQVQRQFEIYTSIAPTIADIEKCMEVVTGKS